MRECGAQGKKGLKGRGGSDPRICPRSRARRGKGRLSRTGARARPGTSCWPRYTRRWSTGLKGGEAQEDEGEDEEEEEEEETLDAIHAPLVCGFNFKDAAGRRRGEEDGAEEEEEEEAKSKSKEKREKSRSKSERNSERGGAPARRWPAPQTARPQAAGSWACQPPQCPYKSSLFWRYFETYIFRRQPLDHGMPTATMPT